MGLQFVSLCILPLLPLLTAPGVFALATPSSHSNMDKSKSQRSASLSRNACSNSVTPLIMSSSDTTGIEASPSCHSTSHNTAEPALAASLGVAVKGKMTPSAFSWTRMWPR
eukprot:3491874-Rhodomonas_salina.4